MLPRAAGSAGVRRGRRPCAGFSRAAVPNRAGGAAPSADPPRRLFQVRMVEQQAGMIGDRHLHGGHPAFVTAKGMEPAAQAHQRSVLAQHRASRDLAHGADDHGPDQIDLPAQVGLAEGPARLARIHLGRRAALDRVGHVHLGRRQPHGPHHVAQHGVLGRAENLRRRERTVLPGPVADEQQPHGRTARTADQPLAAGGQSAEGAGLEVAAQAVQAAGAVLRAGGRAGRGLHRWPGCGRGLLPARLPRGGEKSAQRRRGRIGPQAQPLLQAQTGAERRGQGSQRRGVSARGCLRAVPVPVLCFFS